MFKKRGVKKGQITIFIIAGILILLSFILFFIIRQRISDMAIGREVELTEKKLPSYVLPIKNFVELCIEQNLEQGLKLIEEHGGYITNDLDGEWEPDITATEMNALEFAPNTGYYIPYWWYLESPNYCTSGCTFSSMMPPLCKSPSDCEFAGPNSIENKLENYIITKLKSCLNDFQNFEEEGYEIHYLSDIETDLLLRNTDVIANVNMPLEIKKDGISYSMSDFQYSVPTYIKELYYLARNITQYEVDTCFLDTAVRYYYSYYKGLDVENGDLPPTGDITIATHDISIWILDDGTPNCVKSILKEKTMNAVRLLGVGNTMGYVPVELDEEIEDYDERQAIYDQMVIYPFKEFHDVSVSFSYFPWWDTYLNIQPNEGGILMPDQFTSAEGVYGTVSALLEDIIVMRRYDFSYDYSFPVLMEIRKDYPNGKVEIFRVALEGNIRANDCFTTDTDLSYVVSGEGLACNQNQLVNDIMIRVTDEEDFNEKIEDARVTFFAGQTCDLGFTDEYGVLNAKYPETHGGFFIIRKDGYISKIIQQPFNDIENVELKKYEEFDIDVLKYRINVESSDTDGDKEYLNTFSLSPVPYEISDGGTIFIVVERIPDEIDPLGDFDKQVIIFGKEKLDQKLKLIPGNYRVKVTYISDDTYTIKKHCKHICIKKALQIHKCDEDHNKEYFKLPEKDIDLPITGGLEFNEQNGYWKPDDYLGQGNDRITFFFLQLPKATCLDNECQYSAYEGGCVGIDEVGQELLDAKVSENRIDLEPDFARFS